MTDLPHRHLKLANGILIDTLASLAETRAATKTARILDVTEHCIRSRMRSLEEIEGGQVYTRGNRGNRLSITPLGKELLQSRNVFDFVTTTEAAKTLGIERNTVNNICRDGRMPGAVKQHGMWCIPTEEFQQFAKTYDRTAVASKVYQPRPGFISVEEARQTLGYAYATGVLECLRRGEISGEKVGRFWHIDEQSVRTQKARGKIKRTRKPAKRRKAKAKTPHQIVMERMAKKREAMV